LDTTLPRAIDWKTARKQRLSPEALIEAATVRAPPVPVEHLCRWLGIELHPLECPGWSVALTIQESRAHIFFDSGLRPTRRRFALGNALGALCLHEAERYRSWAALMSATPEDRAANDFAARLLMPEWMLNAWRAGRTTEELAEIFEVSPEAMGVRLVCLSRDVPFG
jgi:hypothetical protein